MSRFSWMVCGLLLATAEPVFAGSPEISIQERALGEGPAVVTGDRVILNYTLRLPDGTILDQNPPGTPFRFTVGHGDVIAGFDQGVIGMKPGSMRIVTIPPELGYGKRGAPPVIPANATLIFEIQLIGIAVERTPPAVPPIVKAEDWQVLPSGTRYADLVVGDGATVPRGARVRVDYTLWNADTNEMFDSSYTGEDAVRLPLDAVVPGLRDAVIGMKVGGKRVVDVPPDQGYGNRDVGQIPADCRLLFLVELDGIEP